MLSHAERRTDITTLIVAFHNIAKAPKNERPPWTYVYVCMYVCRCVFMYVCVCVCEMAPSYHRHNGIYALTQTRLWPHSQFTFYRTATSQALIPFIGLLPYVGAVLSPNFIFFPWKTRNHGNLVINLTMASWVWHIADSLAPKELYKVRTHVNKQRRWISHRLKFWIS
jgi:hypothetical protein